MPSVPRPSSEPWTRPRSRTLASARGVRDGQRPPLAVDSGDSPAEADAPSPPRAAPRARDASLGLSPLPPAPNDGGAHGDIAREGRDTVWSIVAFSEAPKTVNSETTATPIISALAVAAVRFGLRRALRRARAAGDAAQPGEGPPSTRTAASDATGPRTTKAASARPAPRPRPATSDRPLVGGAHARSRATPAARQQQPARAPAGAGRPELVDGRLAQRGQRCGTCRRVRRAAARSRDRRRRRRASGSSMRERADHQSRPRGRGIRWPGTAPAARPRCRCRLRGRRPRRRRATTVASTRVATRRPDGGRRPAPATGRSRGCVGRRRSRRCCGWRRWRPAVRYRRRPAGSVVKSVRNWPEIISVFSSADCLAGDRLDALGQYGPRARSTSSCWPVPGPAHVPGCPRPARFGRQVLLARRPSVSPVKVTWAMPSSPPKVARPTIVDPDGVGRAQRRGVPDRQTALLGGASVETTSPDFDGARAPRPARYGLSLRVADPVAGEGGRALAADGFAVGADELARALDGGHGRRDTGRLLDLVQDRGVDGACGCPGCRRGW